MKSFLRLGCAIFAGTVPFSLNAVAADYSPALVPQSQEIIVQDPIVEEYQPVEIGTSWYLRGDVGYAFSGSVGISQYRTFNGGQYGTKNFDSSSLTIQPTFDIGIGYNYNQYLRGDVTLGGFSGHFNGSTSSKSNCPGAPSGTTCVSKDTADLSAYILMANAYVDLGTYYKITPYVGAGVGASWLNWGDLSNKSTCVEGSASCDDYVATTTMHGGTNSPRFTYAFMAGAAYDLTKNLKVDLGYRYRRIGGSGAFGWDSSAAALGATGTQINDGGISTHEVKLGLRYEIW